MMENKMMVKSDGKPIRLFYVYSHRDERFRNQLETHLSLLRRQRIIENWHDRKIGAGREWEGVISEHLASSQIILLLVSADFINSDYCYDVELAKALEKHEANEARVIPIILRPVDDWKQAPFGRLNALPRDGKPVTKWGNRDEAWVDIAKGIRKAAQELIAKPLVFSEDALPEPKSTAATEEVAPLPNPRAEIKGELTVIPASCDFSDVHPADDFYEAVRLLCSKGLVSGYLDGTFRPHSNMTQGQAVKITASAAGYSEDPGPQIFADVPPGSTFYIWINRLANRGIIGGDATGMFYPNNPITRGQFTMLVANAAGMNEPPGLQVFEDVPPGSMFYEAVQRLAHRGIVSGYPCGRLEAPCVPPANRPYFRPSRYATRGEIAEIVARTFFPKSFTR